MNIRVFYIHSAFARAARWKDGGNIYARPNYSCCSAHTGGCSPSPRLACHKTYHRGMYIYSAGVTDHAHNKAGLTPRSLLTYWRTWNALSFPLKTSLFFQQATDRLSSFADCAWRESGFFPSTQKHSYDSLFTAGLLCREGDTVAMHGIGERVYRA